MPHVTEMFTGNLAFLSNFHPSVIVYEDITYPTVEHAYQAAKTTDVVKRRSIAKLKTPGEAKKAGQPNMLKSIRPDWEGIKQGIMLELLRLKFNHSELAHKLLMTHAIELVESNYWHDQTWGSCYCDKHRDVDGQNLLGKLLMQVRGELTSIDG